MPPAELEVADDEQPRVAAPASTVSIAGFDGREVLVVGVGAGEVIVG
jgi:hypothetical protein